MELSLILPPLTGGVIGWITNYAAIKLLFRPHTPKKVMGLTVQGVIPKRRKEIARSIARAIEKDLLSSHDIAEALKGIDWEREIEKTVSDAVEHRFGKKVSSIPVVGVVSDNLKYHIKYIITRELLRQLDEKKGAFAARFKENIDIKEILVTRIDRLDLKRFEGLLTEFIARELKYLEYLGGVMGFIIGVLQSLFTYFMGY